MVGLNTNKPFKRTYKRFWVQKKEDNKIIDLCHSVSDDGSECYYKFLDKNKAKSLLKAEKKLNSSDILRVVTETLTIEEGNWE